MNNFINVVTRSIIDFYDPLQSQYQIINNFRKMYNAYLLELLTLKDHHDKFVNTLILLLQLCIGHKSFAFLLTKEIEFVRNRIVEFEIENKQFIATLNDFHTTYETFKNRPSPRMLL